MFHFLHVMSTKIFREENLILQKEKLLLNMMTMPLSPSLALLVLLLLIVLLLNNVLIQKKQTLFLVPNIK